MTTKKRTILSKEAEGTLTATQILHREAEYRHDLSDFKKGLIAGEKFKKDGIKKLARDLERAGTIEINKISIRIKSDLQSLTESGLLQKTYIHWVLDNKYKDPKHQHDTKSSQNHSDEEEEQKEVATEEEEEESEEEKEEGTPNHSPVSVQEELEHDEVVDELYHFMRGLTELLTGLKEEELLNVKDNFKLVEDTKQHRFKITKKLDMINLKTIYSDARKLNMVLNDYTKQLDDELGVRQSREELASE